MERKAGILLHISSLPNKYGIGTLGKSAYQFVDFLANAGQKYWQVLPITPTNYGDSPYQSSSVYAFNPYFIDLDMLNEMGLLRKCEYQKEFYGENPQDIDYACLFYVKNNVLKKVWGRHEAYEKHFIKYLASKEAVEEKLLEHGELLKTPIVRNGKKATVGYCPEIWKEWD